jgi:hypothetical protein
MPKHRERAIQQLSEEDWLQDQALLVIRLFRKSTVPVALEKIIGRPGPELQYCMTQGN